MASSQQLPNRERDASPFDSKKDKTLSKILAIKQKREKRRQKNQDRKDQKEKLNEGVAGDIDYELMLEQKRIKKHQLGDHKMAGDLKLCVCVRKRPLLRKELEAG